MRLINTINIKKIHLFHVLAVVFVINLVICRIVSMCWGYGHFQVIGHLWRSKDNFYVGDDFLLLLHGPEN